MNRAVEYLYNDLSPKQVGYLVIFVMRYHEEIYEKNKEHYDKQNKLVNPLELAKYGLKTYRIWEYKGEKVNLLNLRKTNDPLKVIEYSRFTGKFAYDKQVCAYRPLWNFVTGTKIMKDIYDKIEDKRIKRTWEKAKKYLEMYDVEKLRLYYQTEDS